MTDIIAIENQVWASTIHRSMVLQAENDKLKERNDSLNNRDINLCRIANGIRDENFALKELLKKCRENLDELDYGCEVWQGELTGFIKK